MACTIMPFDYLGGTPDQGGTWVLLSGGPADFIVNGNPAATFANGNSIGGSYNFTLDVSETDAGVYVFEYSAGAGTCETMATVTITVVDGVVSGIPNIEFIVCSDVTSVFNLMDLLAGGSGLGTSTGDVTQTGTWSGSGTGPAFTTPPNDAYKPVSSAPNDDTFQPSLVNLNGNNTVQATFIYTVNNGVSGTPAGCTNCTSTSTITFIVTAAGDAGDDGTVTLCNAPA